MFRGRSSQKKVPELPEEELAAKELVVMILWDQENSGGRGDAMIHPFLSAEFSEISLLSCMFVGLFFFKCECNTGSVPTARWNFTYTTV